MAKIRVESKCEIYDGISITFKAPCNNTAVDGLNVYHKGVSRSFTFRDAHGKNLAGVNNLFSAGTYVKAVLDTANNYAYLQNSDTNAYLENVLAAKLDANMGAENAGLYLKVGADGSLIYANPVAKFSQGPVLITETQTLDLSKYGLRVGDQINVICIGGGGAGGSDSYSLGGAAGKGGTGETVIVNNYYYYYGNGGGGGGGGYGGGGGGGTGHDWSTAGNGGGGSGYLTSKTITLTSTTVAVTIGAGGEPVLSSNGGNGGTTSFGSYLSASGGAGGGTQGPNYNNANPGVGGTGGHKGGRGYGTYNSNVGVAGGYGGGGAGGWIVEGFTVYSGTNGEDAVQGCAGNGGTNGGAGGNGGTRGQDAANGFGHGCVVFWY